MRKYPAKIFYCYSHKDEELRDQLEIHLKMLERQNMIKNWHDRKIVVGRKWENEISKKLETSDIVLLLLSPDFLASDYCYEVEMKKALNLHNQNQLQIVPILLRTCDWKSSPFVHLQGLPIDMIPVLDKRWNNIDEAFHNISEGLKGLIQDLFDSYPDPEHQFGDTSRLGETKVVDVELKINKNINEFTDLEQEAIIKSIESFLKLTKPIFVKKKKSGSVILRFELNLDNALKLKYAVDDKLFKEYNVESLKIVDVSYDSEIDENHFLELDYADLRKAVLVLMSVNHKLRQRILEFVYKNKLVTIVDVYVNLGLEQSIASQHLAILRRGGMLTSERKGKNIYYSVIRERVKILAKGVEIVNTMNNDV